MHFLPIYPLLQSHLVLSIPDFWGILFANWDSSPFLHGCFAFVFSTGLWLAAVQALLSTTPGKAFTLESEWAVSTRLGQCTTCTAGHRSSLCFSDPLSPWPFICFFPQLPRSCYCLFLPFPTHVVLHPTKSLCYSLCGVLGEAGSSSFIHSIYLFRSAFS